MLCSNQYSYFGNTLSSLKIRIYIKEGALDSYVETTAAAKKWENSKRGIITGSLGCQNSPICHVKVCYDYISQASPPIDYPTKNCSRQQQGDKFFSLFVYITCYFVIDHLNVIGWLNVDHSVFQKEELWLALIYVCSNCIPFYIIYVSLTGTKEYFPFSMGQNGFKACSVFIILASMVTRYPFHHRKT